MNPETAKAWKENWSTLFEAIETFKAGEAASNLPGGTSRETPWRDLIDAIYLAAAMASSDKPAKPARHRL